MGAKAVRFVLGFAILSLAVRARAETPLERALLHPRAATLIQLGGAIPTYGFHV
jgi:hypothetical protein